MSESLYLRNSLDAALPALREPDRKADLMCVPVAHERNSFGEALLIFDTNWKSWNAALPAPAPPPAPVPTPPVWVTPHDHDSTSISSLWLTSVDSPGMPSIFRNQLSATVSP